MLEKPEASWRQAVSSWETRTVAAAMMGKPLFPERTP
jgi:hypothetical protein